LTPGRGGERSVIEDDGNLQVLAILRYLATGGRQLLILSRRGGDMPQGLCSAFDILGDGNVETLLGRCDDLRDVGD
jgi:hypothetical protein